MFHLSLLSPYCSEPLAMSAVAQFIPLTLLRSAMPAMRHLRQLRTSLRLAVVSGSTGPLAEWKFFR